MIICKSFIQKVFIEVGELECTFNLNIAFAKVDVPKTTT